MEVSTEGDACVFRGVRFTGVLADACPRANGTRSCIVARRGRTRVRMGVHTGIAFPHDGDYIARRSSRTRCDAAQAVRSSLPNTPSMHLTTRRFRRQSRSEPRPVSTTRLRRSRRAVPSWRTRRRSIRAGLPADRHNIVADRTLFVGRQTEVDDLTARLRPGRAVTLVATGGVGKTRLAMEVGLRVAPEWPDGVWMVDLSTVTAGPLVAPTIAETLGIAAAGSDRYADVLEHLGGFSALLILDNCEQVIEQCSGLVRDVLKRCPSMGVLVTSREPLGLAEEDVFRLAPLPVDDEAVTLFLDRSGEAASPIRPPTVTRICERLDGMPLAIELAACDERPVVLGDPRRAQRTLPPAAQQGPHGSRTPAHHEGFAGLELRPPLGQRAHRLQATLCLSGIVLSRGGHRSRGRRRTRSLRRP